MTASAAGRPAAVLAHLGDAAEALWTAVAALTAGRPAHPPADPAGDGAGRERPRTEHIDVTD